MRNVSTTSGLGLGRTRSLPVEVEIGWTPGAASARRHASGLALAAVGAIPGSGGTRKDSGPGGEQGGRALGEGREARQELAGGGGKRNLIDLSSQTGDSTHFAPDADSDGERTPAGEGRRTLGEVPHGMRVRQMVKPGTQVT